MTPSELGSGVREEVAASFDGRSICGGQRQRRAGLGNSPRTILEEIGRIQSTDVVPPLADEPDRELRLRCIVRPDTPQAMLLDRLGLQLPERLRLPSRINEISCQLGKPTLRETRETAF